MYLNRSIESNTEFFSFINTVQNSMKYQYLSCFSKSTNQKTHTLINLSCRHRILQVHQHILQNSREHQYLNLCFQDVCEKTEQKYFSESNYKLYLYQFCKQVNHHCMATSFTKVFNKKETQKKS